MKKIVAITLGLASMAWSGAALAGAVTLYAEPDFRGDRITIRDDVDSLAKIPPWNDRARSVIVHSGVWEICKDKRYDHCQTFAGGARIANTAEVKNLRGGISSLREVQDNWRDGRDRDWDNRRWDNRRWEDDRRPGWGQRDPWEDNRRPDRRADDDGIIWDNRGNKDRGDQWDANPNPTNSCQREVQKAFIQRYGLSGSSRFTGNEYEGTIWWEGQRWNYRCSGGQINIWQ